MRSTTTAAAALFALTASAAPALAQDFRWNGRVASGDQVEVIGISADIEAGPTSGAQVEVTATGLRNGARVEVDEHSGGITVCVIHAGTYRRTRGDDDGRCNVEGRGGRWNRGHSDDVSVRVRIPAGVRFAGRTVSGEVTADGLTADVEASSVSGDVHVSTRGTVEAQSVSGDVEVSMGRLPRSGTLEFRSVSGSLEITLPSDAGAEIRAETLSGDIQSDFPLEVSGRNRGRYHVQVGNRARGTIGNGGPRVELETVSGDIRVRRR
jgi:hypothetical protein